MWACNHKCKKASCLHIPSEDYRIKTLWQSEHFNIQEELGATRPALCILRRAYKYVSVQIDLLKLNRAGRVEFFALHR